jgi:hypothetical protein
MRIFLAGLTGFILSIIYTGQDPGVIYTGQDPGVRTRL